MVFCFYTDFIFGVCVVVIVVSINGGFYYNFVVYGCVNVVVVINLVFVIEGLVEEVIKGW